MIITRLIGGLGNQLFQYAYGLYLADHTGQELFIDESAFANYRLHALAIDHFSITANRVREEHRRRIPGRYRGRSRVSETLTQFVGAVRRSPSAPLRLRREKPFGFQKEYLAPGHDLYLDGYWQGEAFFPNMRQKLRKEFTLANPLSSKSQAVARQIDAAESVAVHVRRGDYVTNSETGRIYRCLDADYYRSCLQDLRQHVANPKIFLFSNDIDWCLDNLDVGIAFTPVTHNDSSTAHEDLHLISRCRHAVIANSTFSWWGAFLGDARADRRVYYPSPWFNPGTMDGQAICCNEWISERSVAVDKNLDAAA